MKKLHVVSTATLTSQLLKRGFRNTFIAGLRPLWPDLRLVSYAFTLRYVPAREDVGFHVDYDNTKNVQRLAVRRSAPGACSSSMLGGARKQPISSDAPSTRQACSRVLAFAA